MKPSFVKPILSIVAFALVGVIALATSNAGSTNGQTFRYNPDKFPNYTTDPILPGATLTEAVYVAADPPQSFEEEHGPIQQVLFKLNGEVTRTDKGAPYKLLRNSQPLDACALPAGRNKVTATVLYQDGFERTFAANFDVDCRNNDNVTLQDTARLAGYFFADGRWNDDDKTWTVRTPNGTGDLVKHLVAKHGGEQVGYDGGFVFSLAGTDYDWDGKEWYDSIPDNDSYLREAVKDPNFLAAMIEGEGSNYGLISDHTTNPAANQNLNYTTERLESIRDLLRDVHGLSSAQLILWNRPGSGQVKVTSDADYNTIRTMPFVCPKTAKHRVPGGTSPDYIRINWIDAMPADWVAVVGYQCEGNDLIGY